MNAADRKNKEKRRNEGKEKTATASIVIPTYNEKRNIGVLVPEIFKSCKGLKAKIEVVIVDDNSPDGTGKAAEELSKKYNVIVVHRSRKLGLASAVIKGFYGSKSEILGAMDADLSHPPQVIPKLIKPVLSREAEVVVGSRYVKGGGVEVWPFHRRLMSKVATMMAKPLTPVKDPMSGLFFLRRSVIDGVELKARGYKIGLEILVKGRYKKVLEVPYMFRNRFVGKSKIGVREYYHYVRSLMDFCLYRLAHRR
ncbi:polyprenol monophosphomannose synthase [Candidatus Woesearchaeota archaeon]|nr:polyprenol monophosphomannose synthase [Candidatus Woesearchaeota archaeon]